MKASQIRELRDDELQDKLEELEKRVFEIRSQSVTEKISDSHATRNVRKDVARIKTIMRERQLKGQ